MKNRIFSVIRRAIALSLCCMMLSTVVLAAAPLGGAIPTGAKNGDIFYIDGEYYRYVEKDYYTWKRVDSKGELPTNAKGDRVLFAYDTGYDGYVCINGNSIRKDGDDWGEEQVELRSDPDALKGLGDLRSQDTFVTEGHLSTPFLYTVSANSEDGYSYRMRLSREDGSMSNGYFTHDGDEVISTSRTDPWYFHMRSDGYVNISEDDEPGEMGIDAFGANFYLVDEDDSGCSHVEFLMFICTKIESKRELELIDLGDPASPSADGNIVNGQITFYEWKRVRKYSDLPKDKNKTFRALLIWGNNDQYYFEGNDWFNKDGEFMLEINSKDYESGQSGNVEASKVIDVSSDSFYSLDGLNTPYITYAGDNGSDKNDYCPMYYIECADHNDNPSDVWLHDGGEEVVLISEKGYKNVRHDKWGIIVGKGGSSEKNDAASGHVKVFFHDSFGWDTGLCQLGNRIRGHWSSDWADFQDYVMYIGTEVTFPAITKNYRIGANQYAKISQNAVIDKSATVTVTDGATFSIESWVMNNGTIIVDGGTLIVQDGGCLLPFADLHSHSARLEIKNGGDVVVLNGGRAAFSTVDAENASSIVNCGLFLSLRSWFYDSILDNRGTGTFFAGYDFREMTFFKYRDLTATKNGNVMPPMKRMLPSDIDSVRIDSGSGILNRGSITYSTTLNIESGARTGGNGKTLCYAD